MRARTMKRKFDNFDVYVYIDSKFNIIIKKVIFGRNKRSLSETLAHSKGFPNIYQEQTNKSFYYTVKSNFRCDSYLFIAHYLA